MPGGWEELVEGCPHVTNDHLQSIEEIIIRDRGGDIFEGGDGDEPIFSSCRFEKSLSDDGA